MASLSGSSKYSKPSTFDPVAASAQRMATQISSPLCVFVCVFVCTRVQDQEQHQGHEDWHMAAQDAVLQRFWLIRLTPKIDLAKKIHLLNSIIIPTVIYAFEM